MRGAVNVLPSDFSDLEPFVKWSVPTEGERIRIRTETPDEELSSFYEVAMPRLDDIAAYLNRFPLDALPEDATRLFHLAKSVIEVANTVEHGRSTVAWRFDISRFIPTHEKRVRQS